MTRLASELNYPPSTISHIHLMGICGTGMAALAGMLKAQGYKITGSDSHVYPPMSIFLDDLGIPIYDGYQAKNLTPSPDLVIVGNVITKKNPEAKALANTDIAYLSFPQALCHFFINNKKSLVVAGTHGKTTSCSLLASALYHANQDPSFMIGGLVKEFSANFRLGNGPFFVTEGDEYDTAFFDKESKFLHYQPEVAILTSIEFDHADIFNDLEQIKKAFRKFIKLLPEDGLLVANYDDPVVRELATQARCEVQSYGLGSVCHWSLKNIQTTNGSSAFDIFYKGSFFAPMQVQMTGDHNCCNTLAVCAVLNHLGIGPGEMARGLQGFEGVKRRQEVRGVVQGVVVIDDFAHHPTAVRETLAAIKKGYPEKRLLAVFEPRTNSSRRAIFQQQYTTAFAAADKILLREPIPLDGLTAKEMFSSSRLAKDLRDKGAAAKAFATTDEIINELTGLVKKDDVVAILSNGGFDNIHQRLLTELKERL